MLTAGLDGQRSGIRSFHPILAMMWEKISNSRVSGEGGTLAWWAHVMLSAGFPLRDAPSSPSFPPACGSWHLLHSKEWAPSPLPWLATSPQHLTSPQLKRSPFLHAGSGLTAWGTMQETAAPPLTSSIWPLSQTETGKTVSEERIPGTFTRRCVNSARIACTLARGRVAWRPGAFEGPCYDSKQWNHSQLQILYNLPSPFPAWTSEAAFRADLSSFACAHKHACIHTYTRTHYTHTHTQTHIYTFTCTHTHVSTCIHTCTHTCIWKYTLIHMYTQCTHTCTCTCTHIHMHTHTCACTRIHTHTHVYTNTPTHTHDHTNINTCLYTHNHTYSPIYMHIHKYTYRHTYTHKHIDTLHINMHTHLHTCTLLRA